TIQSAGDRFVEDATSRHLSQETVNKYRLLFREMVAYFGSREVKHIGVADLASFRATWEMGALTSLKKLERLRSFFKFCEDRKWVSSNPAKLIKSPKTDSAPTLPFSSPEWEKILWATEVYPNRGLYGYTSVAHKI